MNQLAFLVLPLVSLGLVNMCRSAEAETQSLVGSADSQKMEHGEGQGIAEIDGPRQSSRYDGSPKEVRGKIERVKTVLLRGTRQGHLTILLSTIAERRMVVDLGPASRFRNVDLRAGDWIVVHGPIGRVNDRRVLFAQQVHIDGEIIQIDRQVPVKYSAPKMHSITGKVAIIKEFKIKGGDQVHQVVRIMTEEGTQLVVDLGETSALKEITPTYGHEISIEGPMARLSGKPFLLALKVTSQGKTAHIERALLSGMAPSRETQRVSAGPEVGTRKVTREIVVSGEVVNIDRDGLYVVRDPSGKEVHLLVTEDLNTGLKVGDQIQAQVVPDGSVTSILRSSDSQPGETPRDSQEE